MLSRDFRPPLVYRAPSATAVGIIKSLGSLCSTPRDVAINSTDGPGAEYPIRRPRPSRA